MSFTNEFREAAFSSQTGKWNTPQNLIDDLTTVFDWDCDVCAERPNVCDFYYDEEQDGLSQKWEGLCWMNPPYGENIQSWLTKAWDESKIRYNTAVVCLLPVRPDTRWWQFHVPYASQVVFIKGRLKFSNSRNSAPFPSAFAVFGKISDEQRNKLAEYGWSILL